MIESDKINLNDSQLSGDEIDLRIDLRELFNVILKGKNSLFQ